MDKALTRLTEPAPVVGVAANVDGVAGRPAHGQPPELAALPEVGPPPGLATEDVGLLPEGLGKQDAIAQVLTRGVDGPQQHLQLVLLQLLEEGADAVGLLLSRTPGFIASSLSGLNQAFSEVCLSAAEHEH